MVKLTDEVVPPLPNVTYDGVVVPPVAIVTVFTIDVHTFRPAHGIDVANFAVITYSTKEFAGTVGTVQVTVLATTFIAGVPGKLEDTYSKPFGRVSVTVILLAIAAPLFVTLIVKVTKSLSLCGLIPIKFLATDSTGYEKKLAEAVWLLIKVDQLYNATFAVFVIETNDCDKIIAE